MAKMLNWLDIFSFTCAGAKKWGLYLATSDSDIEQLSLAVPYLSGAELFELSINGFAIFLFDTALEMQAAFNQTVGDDGPTSSNPYDGPAKVFACTCSPKGTVLNENT